MSELKRFFESHGGRKVSSQELIDFKRSCSDEEYEMYVKMATGANRVPVAA